ncbi:MAG: redox-regulated ATPase YchF [Candidatus Pacebacteria bacterium]|nr:redox-regulated ATPase YchF [Candidatus Paceibacterota bacterium]NCS97803.1 redox-regulated ATPase YchF [Candidatus Paceibacterota bacterium]PIR63390.1 MAG: redox-regulated ATPase YchF [Candidatus Pacebacteria bacterium CG10_big_fil_rev_8_21_14_0_10_40_26]PIZ79138.1 MAG: redox-regulated ATPase YchF [Candidatus Pacebacteria bacterium CG_4_10_14_0_2_um_filter_40_20]PJC42104.1 MAG: redox-regulated ATPase YchF [Candidatus Pacebacteria bacterium CG_4_9_14_0_2_um_filter_40_15]
MSLSAGIVGLPNVGKSTLFNALLKRQVALAANYPFATIDPNTGVVPVPDERLEVLAKHVGTTIIKPATVEFVDIAGLVKGASQGEGLGNKFLANIREVDLICHVVRGFTDDSILREGSVDPLSDKEIIETELLLADLATLEKQRPPKASKDKDLLFRWDVIEAMLTAAREGIPVATVLDTPEKQKVGRELGLLTAKKSIYVINVDESVVGNQDAEITKYADMLEVHADQVVIVSAKIEAEVATLAQEDAALFLEELGLKTSGLERLISRAFTQLGLQTYLTAGELEVRAWTIHQGMTAPEAAGVIHTDFQKKFIKAKVISYADFLEFGGWKGTKEKGKQRLEGKDYVMQPDDVVEFMVGA